MRVLWLIDSLTLGGAESLVVTFASAARAHGIDLTVCALTTIDGNPVEARLRAIGAEVVTLGARNLRDRGAFRRLLALIRERDVQVIHSHLTYASTWGAIASARTRVPHVATLHTLPVTPRANWRDRTRQRLMAFMLSRYAFRVIAVSQAQAGAWAGRGLLRGEKIAVVANAVEYPANADRQNGGTGNTVGTVAVLREGKGIDVLLRAWRLVLQQQPGASLVIAGDGPLRMSLVSAAQQLGISGAVQWLGYRSDVPEILASLDLFVHPTLQDALPTAVLEAMAAGLPVVASAAGGVPEIITDGVNGLLVPPGDEVPLANAIVRVLRDDALRHRLADKGRQTVTQRFSVERWVDTLHAIYARAMGNAS